MCACVRLYVYECSCMFVYLPMIVSAHVLVCLCSFTCVRVSVCVRVCVHVCVHACVRVRVNAVNASVCIQQTHCMFVLQNKPNILWNPGPAKPSTGSCAGGFEWEDESRSQQMLCVY